MKDETLNLRFEICNFKLLSSFILHPFFYERKDSRLGEGTGR
jgi:hypothetical protein